ncbi:MAG TPA: hypothetical protein VF519_15530 [Mycobacteriales bacterium]|jgi:hypothetical protein
MIVTDTAPVAPRVDELKRARLARRVLLTLFATVLALGATGRLGVRTAHARASGGGYDLVVEYPRVTRPGHAVPLSVRVHKGGGFGGEPIQVRVSTGYFALFDENGVQPAPSMETATATHVMWEFDPPPGDVLRIYFDTRSGPNRQRGTTGEVAVLANGVPVVGVTIRTTVMP